MAKIKSIFSNKKAKTDGQEEYFKEDFRPVVTKSEKKATEKSAPKKSSEPKKVEKKVAVSSNRVAPQPVEKIINPKTSTKAVGKKAAAKAAIKAEKEAAKASKKNK